MCMYVQTYVCTYVCACVLCVYTHSLTRINIPRYWTSSAHAREGFSLCVSYPVSAVGLACVCVVCFRVCFRVCECAYTHAHAHGQ
jgi:hypothetical protein